MNDRLRHSRWRRLPGLHRITDRKLPDHRAEPQRLTLYLPGRLLDLAEALAYRDQGRSVQEYCERLLIERLEALAGESEPRPESPSPRTRELASLDALADDPEYLAEWTATIAARRNPTPASPTLPPSLGPPPPPGPSESVVLRSDPAAVVARHAADGVELPDGFLPSLRRGEPIPGPVASELLTALNALEGAFEADDPLPRGLGYDLHRIAFEGQVLLSDAWPAAGADPATVDALLLVQEAVARVLSGADFRYEAENTEPGDAR